MTIRPGAAAVVLGRMDMKPDHARRACREFVSKKVIPRDLSINPHAFATTLDAMRHTRSNQGSSRRRPSCMRVLTCSF